MVIQTEKGEGWRKKKVGFPTATKKKQKKGREEVRIKRDEERG